MKRNGRRLNPSKTIIYPVLLSWIVGTRIRKPWLGQYMKTKLFPLLFIVILLFTGFIGQVASAADPPPTLYLYFSQEELINLRALRTAPSHQATWNSIKSWADTYMSYSPPTQPTGEGFIGYWDAIERNGIDGKPPIRRFVETMAFMYAMTEDTAYAEAAKEWMLELASWSTWQESGTPGQCDAMAIKGITFGYDILSDYLSVSEKQTISDRVATSTQAIYDYWSGHEDNPEWWGWGYPNAIGLRGMALILSGLVFTDQPDAGTWYNSGLTLTQTNLDTAFDYSEGISYDALACFAMVAALDPVKRIKGDDRFQGSSLLMERGLLYNYLNYNDKPIQFEDGAWYEGFETNTLPFLYKLGSEYNDGYANWFADNYADKDNVYSYIWKDPNVVSISPTGLPLTRHFGDIGYVVARSGWDNDDLVFAFKSGSSKGHSHNSQNEFAIYYQGKPITGGPGYVSNRVTDDTWSHNCILVDGNGQCQELGDYQSCSPLLGTRGQITAFEESAGNYVYMLGDASAVYTGWSGTSDGRTYTVGDLDKWLRHVVFVRNPNYFVIFDQLEAPSPKQFNMIINLPQLKWNSAPQPISVSGALISMSQEGIPLNALIVEPKTFSYDIISYNERDSGEANQIRVNTPTATETAEFLTVLYPDAVLPVEEVQMGNLLGVIITPSSDTKELVLFSSDGNPVDQYVELGGYYQAIDGGSYTFDGTRVRAQFDTYQVMRLEQVTEQPPIAEFSATLTTGDKPLSVQFSDQSEGSITGWLWDFGDGATSTEQNPLHMYTSAGVYTVSLTVAGSPSDTETKTDYISVYEPAPFIPGDANEDGVVNSLDITKVKRIIMGLDEPTPGVDANEDGNINALDITQIELIIMGS